MSLSTFTVVDESIQVILILIMTKKLSETLALYGHAVRHAYELEIGEINVNGWLKKRRLKKVEETKPFRLEEHSEVFIQI